MIQQLTRPSTTTTGNIWFFTLAHFSAKSSHVCGFPPRFKHSVLSCQPVITLQRNYSFQFPSLCCAPDIGRGLFSPARSSLFRRCGQTVFRPSSQINTCSSAPQNTNVVATHSLPWQSSHSDFTSPQNRSSSSAAIPSLPPQTDSSLTIARAASSLNCVRAKTEFPVLPYPQRGVADSVYDGSPK